MSSRNPNHRKHIYLDQTEKRAEALFDSIEDYDRPNCKNLFNAITQNEYVQNAVHGMRRKAQRGLPPKKKLLRNSDKRELLFDRCVLPKQGNPPEEGFFGNSDKLIRLRWPDEKQAFDFVEEAVSGEWRRLPCEEIANKILDSNAALGRLFGVDGAIPENAYELKNAVPRFNKRCLREIGHIPSRVSQEEEFRQDATVQRGRMLELEGVKKRKRR